MRKLVVTSVALCAAILFGTNARRPGAGPATDYGESLNRETAKKAEAAAAEELKKNGSAIALTSTRRPAISSSSNGWTCQFGSIAISQHKAKAAATFTSDQGVRGSHRRGRPGLTL